MSPSFAQSGIKALKSEDFEILQKELQVLNELYLYLPVSETIKNQYCEKVLKTNSAWYSCLVNSNIDELLLPEYIESKQSRNILIKKETEQYYKSLDNFQFHKKLGNTQLFECLVYSDKGVKPSGFDLFSTQVQESASCPEDLKELFASWDLEKQNRNSLEHIITCFNDWFKYSTYSFSNQRQMVLWMNFQLYKLFGKSAQFIQTEHFFFNTWKQEANAETSNAFNFLNYCLEKSKIAKAELKELYKSQINFTLLKPLQKVSCNFVFENAFDTDAPFASEILKSKVWKQLQRKGFVRFSDYENREEIEKENQWIQTLIESETIKVIREDNEIGLYINCSLKNKELRLYQYQNIRAEKQTFNAQDFCNQVIIQPVVQAEQAKESIPVMQAHSLKRQKAFFG